MKEVKKITYNEQLIAVIIPAEYRAEGIDFFTPQNFSQQLGYMNRPAGYEIPPHVHRLVLREIQLTQETLLVRSGRIRVDLYTPEKQFLQSEELSTGDVILLASGGHGFLFLEPSELIEIKQGPYLSFEVDKERFS
jgi:hypothetical protein